MQREKSIRPATLSLLAFALWVVAIAAYPQSSSPRYILQQATMNTGGGTSVSPSGTAHRVDDSLGQESVNGCSSSFHFVLQSDFWSFLGPGLVPVVLTVAKNSGDPALPDLSWTRNNPDYFVCRFTDPSAIFSGLSHTQTLKDWTDTSPPDAPVVYYSVLATAPGRFAPAEMPEHSASFAQAETESR